MLLFCNTHAMWHEAWRPPLLLATPGTFPEIRPVPGPRRGQCAVLLWCWPAFGNPFGLLHCEYEIEGSRGGNGRCRGESGQCATLGLRICCASGCASAVWQPNPPPVREGAVIMGRRILPESACQCLRSNCSSYPRTKCYAPIPDRPGEGNSNTVADCLNSRCSLGFTDPGNAPGWGWSCPWR